MILLETNVISEVMKPRADVSVVDWMNATASGSLFVSSVTIAEIHYGIELLPDDGRRIDPESRFDRFMSQGFDGRIVSFDAPAAGVHGTLMAHRRNAGTPLASLDGQIGSIARVHGFAVATRYTGLRVHSRQPPVSNTWPVPP